MERLKEIISSNYTTDFPEGFELENQEEYMKSVREDEQADNDSDSDHVIVDETDDVLCIDFFFFFFFYAKSKFTRNKKDITIPNTSP